MLDRFETGATVADVEGRRRLVFDDEDSYRMAIAEFPIGLRVIVTIEEEKERRSKTWEQVKYWWAVPVQLCAEHCGTTDERMHRDLLGECFGYETNQFKKQVPIKPSMSTLTVEEMTHLISWVLDWAPDTLEVVVPPPDKDWKRHAETIRKQRRRVA